MEKNLEFEFKAGGRLYFERLANGEMLIRIQAIHPGYDWKITSTTAIIDVAKVEEIRKWFEDATT